MRTPQARIHAYIQDALTTGQHLEIAHIAQGVKTLPKTRKERRALAAWMLSAHPGVYSQLQAQFPTVLADEPCTMAYTTAPESYDGFGTETVAVVGTLDGKPLRKIETPSIFASWQAQRNGSGLHSTYTETEFTHVRQMPWFQPIVHVSEETPIDNRSILTPPLMQLMEHFNSSTLLTTDQLLTDEEYQCCKAVEALIMHYHLTEKEPTL